MRLRLRPWKVGLFALLLAFAACDCGRGAKAPAEAPEPRQEQPAFTSAPSIEAPTNAFERARALFHAGNRVEGEALLEQAVQSAARVHGAASDAHGQALYDLATYHLMSGAQEAALQSLAQALEATREAPDQRLHLTIAMNDGEFLQLAGRHAEAELVHRAGLLGRAAYYGKQHPGYAFGLDALAWSLLAQGKAAEALERAEEAVAILRATSHPKAAGSALVAALARRDAKGDYGDLASALSPFTVERISEIRASVSSGVQIDPRRTAPLLTSVIALLSAQPGMEADVEALLSDQIRAATAIDDLRLRRAAFEQLVQLNKRRGDLPRSIEAEFGVALADQALGNIDAALARHKAVAARDDLPPALHARAYRELGLFLAEQQRPREAAIALATSTQLARSAPADDPALPKALGAQGIFLQHMGDATAAKPLLAEAERSLSEVDPDGLAVRSHLRSLQAGKACDCKTQMPLVVAELLTERLRKALGKGAIGEVKQSEGQWTVSWLRDPSAEEQESTQRIIRHTLAEIVQR